MNFGASWPKARRPRKAAGKITTQLEERKPGAAAPDKLTLSKPGVPAKDAKPAAEDLLAKERQAKEANARVAELAKNISDLNKLAATSAAAAKPATVAAPAVAPAVAAASAPAPGLSVVAAAAPVPALAAASAAAKASAPMASASMPAPAIAPTPIQAPVAPVAAAKPSAPTTAKPAAAAPALPRARAAPWPACASVCPVGALQKTALGQRLTRTGVAQQADAEAHCAAIEHSLQFRQRSCRTCR